MKAMEEYILKVLNEQPDGFIVPNQTEFYNNNIHEFFEAIQRLIDKGILRKRNCDGLAYEYNRQQNQGLIGGIKYVYKIK